MGKGGRTRTTSYYIVCTNNLDTSTIIAHTTRTATWSLPRLMTGRYHLGWLYGAYGAYKPVPKRAKSLRTPTYPRSL